MPKPAREYKVINPIWDQARIVDVVTLYRDFDWLPHEANELADLKIGEESTFGAFKITRLS
jgi:hypothetical protein